MGGRSRSRRVPRAADAAAVPRWPIEPHGGRPLARPELILGVDVVRLGADWRTHLDAACGALARPHVGVWLRLAGVPNTERAQIAASVGLRGHPRLAVGAAPDEANRWGYRAIHLPGALLGAARPADLADFAWSTCAAHDRDQLAAAEALGVTLAWLSPVADVPTKGRVALADDARSALLSAANVPVGALGGVSPSNAARWYAEGFAALATFGSWPTLGLNVWPRRTEASDVAGQGASR